MVTGASGFIGTRLVSKLASAGHNVVAVDIDPPRATLPGVRYERADVREALSSELAQGVETIYNFAAVHRTPGHLPHEYYQANVLGALNVTALAEASDVNRIVFTSSISVYGPSEIPLTEQMPLKPTSDYGRSKWMAELIHRRWRAAGPNRKLIVVRPGVVFGPGERGNYTHLVRALRRGYFVYPGRTDVVKGGGFVDELLHTLDFAIAHAELEITYNFAYPYGATTREIIQTIAELEKLRANYPVVPLLFLQAVARASIARALFGARSPFHPDRVAKLVTSTSVAPAWLLNQNYCFQSDLRSGIERWLEEDPQLTR
jgi:nucleoside-diphosphate-sugar epimerase